MNFHRDARTLLFLSGPLLTILTWGCSPPTTIRLGEGPITKPVRVDAFRCERTENVEESAVYFGSVQPNRRLTLGFTVGGRIASLPVPQQRCPGNSVIAALDHAALLEQREVLAAEVARIPEALRGTPQTASLQEQLQTLDRQIEQRQLVAPFDCVVEQRHQSENSLCGPQSPVVTVVDTSQPHIEIDLPRDIARRIEAGREYVFLMGKRVIQAGLEQKSLTEKPAGIVRIWFRITSDLQFDVSFGEPVECRFQLPSNTSGCWLPLTALSNNSHGLWSVFVIRAEGTATRVEQQLVEVRQLRDDRALVDANLEGTMIVRHGLHRIVTGQRVEIASVVPQEAAAGIPEDRPR